MDCFAAGFGSGLKTDLEFTKICVLRMQYYSFIDGRAEARGGVTSLQC